jgi:hypothetical protein
MTADPDFEDHLFALYGEPSRSSEDKLGDGDVTERVLREIAREERLRARLLTAAASVGMGLAAGALTMFGGPVIAQAAALSGAPPLALWLAMFAGAASLSWAAARLALDA